MTRAPSLKERASGGLWPGRYCSTMLQSQLHGVVSQEKLYRELDLLQIWQEDPDLPECKPKYLNVISDILASQDFGEPVMCSKRVPSNFQSNENPLS